jgi:hypothetical protein
MVELSATTWLERQCINNRSSIFMLHPVLWKTNLEPACLWCTVMFTRKTNSKRRTEKMLRRRLTMLNDDFNSRIRTLKCERISKFFERVHWISRTNIFQSSSVKRPTNTDLYVQGWCLKELHNDMLLLLLIHCHYSSQIVVDNTVLLQRKFIR